jgi:hypothetical protein
MNERHPERSEGSPEISPYFGQYEILRYAPKELYFNFLPIMRMCVVASPRSAA